MFTNFDLEKELTDFEFEAGMSEKVIDTAEYRGFKIELVATTKAKYAHVRISSVLGSATLGKFGGAIRHYLYCSNQASGPIRGRKITEFSAYVIGNAYRVDYIIDNPLYSRNNIAI